MNNIVMAAAVVLLLLFGCEKTDAKKSRGAPAAREQALQPKTVQGPNYQGLVEEYRAILAEDPNNPAVIIALGNAYFDSRLWKKAIMMYEHALSTDPRNGDVRADMGTAYRNIGMADRALAEYRTVLKYDPEHLNARYNLGIVYAYDKKDYRTAIRIWEDLLKVAPNYPHAEGMKSMIITLKQKLKKEAR